MTVRTLFLLPSRLASTVFIFVFDNIVAGPTTPPSLRSRSVGEGFILIRGLGIVDGPFPLHKLVSGGVTGELSARERKPF
jgi:hypothetical protein